MCGIIGIISNQNISDALIDGLARLEYRGYDSAGIAYMPYDQKDADQKNVDIMRLRAAGKLSNLAAKVSVAKINTHLGIAHTRWATHGIASVNNAHPHATERVAVVHNGIIENYHDLKTKLMQNGAKFESETDTEVIVHLLDYHLSVGLSPLEAVKATLPQLHGAFAIAIIFKQHPNLLIGARKGSPLVLGITPNALYLGSDAWALAAWTNEVCYLEDGDLAVLDRTSTNKFNYQVYDKQYQEVERPLKRLQLALGALSKGGYSHYMLKEIFEQPDTVANTLLSLIDQASKRFRDHDFEQLSQINFQKIERIRLIACGSSYYASMAAKYWFESNARISVEVDLASEFRYRNPVFGTNEICIVVSQSGETIDTLEALKLVKQNNIESIAIVNVPESAMARLADHTILTMAGPEIGVASTKAFSAQVMVLAALSIFAGNQRKILSDSDLNNEIEQLLQTPKAITNIIQDTSLSEQIGMYLANVRDVLFIGRGLSYPLALEGALKLKEISYIHSEAYAAGELKHGPIALVDKHIPLIALLINDHWFEKTLSNVEEVAARGAPIILISNCMDRCKQIKNPSYTFNLSDEGSYGAYMQSLVVVQLIAYYTALHKGTDVDQPRNLAKSVTVE